MSDLPVRRKQVPFLVLAPSLVTDPADAERAVDALDRTLQQGLGRLTARFLKEKAGSLW